MPSRCRPLLFSRDPHRVFVSSDAAVPVRHPCEAILEVAEQIRTVNRFDPSTITAEMPMRIHVGNYVISYLLDLDRRVAKVVFVDGAGSESPGI